MLLWWRLSLQMPRESSPFWEALHVPMPRECSREPDSFPSWFPCGLCGMGLVFWRILMLSSEKRYFDLETWDHSSSFSILSGGKTVCSSGYKRIIHPKAERAETSMPCTICLFVRTQYTLAPESVLELKKTLKQSRQNIIKW